MEEFNAILIMICRITKFAIFIPIGNDTIAEKFARLFHKHIDLWFGPPAGIVNARAAAPTKLPVASVVALPTSPRGVFQYTWTVSPAPKP